MLPLGVILLCFPPIFLGIGSFAADFNETHVYNPNWPPHARFHNGQTMSMAALLGVAGLWYTLRSRFLPTPTLKLESLFAAAIIGSFYTVSGMSAILYPGSKGTDPEFGPDSFPQKYVFGFPLVVNWIGYWLEARRLGQLGEKKGA